MDMGFLAARAKEGDTAAFSQLYAALYKDLYYFALSRAGNPHDAADAVSDAVLDAFSGIQKLQNPASFKSWIFTILNRKLTHFRKPRFIEDQPDISYTADFTGVEVLEALGALSTPQRTVFSLSAMCGMNAQEISEITGMKPATVRSHLLRARKKLMADYSEYEKD